MKFGKVLKNASEEMPHMNDLFLRYKELKKKLKAIPRDNNGTGARTGSDSDDDAAAATMKQPKQQEQQPHHHHQQEQPAEHTQADAQHQASSHQLSQEELEFISTLNEDLQRFNGFFIDKEEDAVIQLQALQDQLQAAREPAQLNALKQAFVDFHGEMVLLLHWSVLNYAAVVKILKKHDKHTGLLLRAPFLASVLQQPFASTSVMSRLVTMAEEKVRGLVGEPEGREGAAAGQAPAAAAAEEKEEEAGAVAPAEADANAGAAVAVAAVAAVAKLAGAAADGDDAHANAMLRRTQTALDTWHTMQKTASTPSTVLTPSSSTLLQQLAQQHPQQHPQAVPQLLRQTSLQAQQQQLLELQQELAQMDSDDEQGPGQQQQVAPQQVGHSAAGAEQHRKRTLQAEQQEGTEQAGAGGAAQPSKQQKLS